MRIILWLTLFLAAFCAAGAVSGERLPVFEKPDRSSDIIGSIEAARIPASVRPVTGYTVRHPLAAYHAYYPLPGGGMLYHLDLYRIAGSASALAFGVDEFLDDPDSLALIEWPERIADIIPGDAIQVRIRHISDTEREISVTGNC